MSLQLATTTLPSSYTVWVFVLGSECGPRRMKIRVEDDDHVGIMADQKVFGIDASVETMVLTVNEKLYRVYFDQTLHKTNRGQATHVFLRLYEQDLALDFGIKDDLLNMLDALTRCFNFVSIVRVQLTEIIESRTNALL